MKHTQTIIKPHWNIPTGDEIDPTGIEGHWFIDDDWGLPPFEDDSGLIV